MDDIPPRGFTFVAGNKMIRIVGNSKVLGECLGEGPIIGREEAHRYVGFGGRAIYVHNVFGHSLFPYQAEEKQECRLTETPPEQPIAQMFSENSYLREARVQRISSRAYTGEDLQHMTHCNQDDKERSGH